MKLAFLPWLILLLPLLAAVGITLFTLPDRRWSGRLSVGAVLAGFVFTVVFLVANGWQPAVAETGVTWLRVDTLEIGLGLRLDPLSLMLLLVVTGVGGAIHVYSLGYIRDDPGYGRYFASLSFFTFAMLGVVLANNLLMLFVFWELVGVSSYLLIGFWFERPRAADAAKKAFLTNRLGDFGFLLGILLVWFFLGSLHFGSLERLLQERPEALGPLATLIGLLLFCGAVGKSAQAPLHVWLPDAMEGPTPVSALIHAATMVAAGVYLLCRVVFLLDPTALLVIAWVGGITALFAAVVALQQDDIKRILAYSTLSQLGMMILAVGVAAPGVAMFHLTTHAFFKALLFLGAGSVILALHHEQNIWRMGGLRQRMPLTFYTFLAGTLALCGVPPLSGFFSKDAVMAAALAGPGGLPLFVLIGLVAVLTTFYMFRLFLVAFVGTPRSESAGHAQESPWVMTGPLVLLAGLSVAGGFFAIPRVFARQWGPASDAHAVMAVAGSLLALAAGLVLAFRYYRGATEDPLPAMFGGLTRVIRQRFYLDELYERTVIRLHDVLAEAVNWLERWIVAGLLVRGLQGMTELTGRSLRMLQTGNVQTYAFLLVLGVVLLLVAMMGR